MGRQSISYLCPHLRLPSARLVGHKETCTYENRIHLNDATNFIDASVTFAHVATTFCAYINAAKCASNDTGAGSHFQVVQLVDATEASVRVSIHMQHSHIVTGHSIHPRALTYVWSGLLLVAIVHDAAGWTTSAGKVIRAAGSSNVLA